MRAEGATALPVRSSVALDAVLGEVDGVIVDLTARAYDGVAAIASATAAGRPVMAVGQHDDRALRQRALEAGVGRVYPYRRLFDDGARQVGAWLAEVGAGEPTAT